MVDVLSIFDVSWRSFLMKGCCLCLVFLATVVWFLGLWVMQFRPGGIILIFYTSLLDALARSWSMWSVVKFPFLSFLIREVGFYLCPVFSGSAVWLRIFLVTKFKPLGGFSKHLYPFRCFDTFMVDVWSMLDVIAKFSDKGCCVYVGPVFSVTVVCWQVCWSRKWNLSELYQNYTIFSMLDSFMVHVWSLFEVSCRSCLIREVFFVCLGFPATGVWLRSLSDIRIQTGRSCIKLVHFSSRCIDTFMVDVWLMFKLKLRIFR